MCVSEKPSACDIEQAGVAVIDGPGEGSRVIIYRLLLIGVFSLTVSCNIIMFLWVRNLEKNVNVIAENNLKLLEKQINFRAKYDDDNDDNEAFPFSDDLVVRALRDGGVKNVKRVKGKNRKNRNRKKKSKRGCACDDLIKKLKSKRDVSGQSHIFTYMKGLHHSAYAAQPYNNEGQFLWQQPDMNLGNYFYYNKDSSNNIKAIRIGIAGAYEFKAQVTLGGSSSTVDNPECGVDLVKSRGGNPTQLARTVITQIPGASYSQHNNEQVLDNVMVGGIFYLTAGDEVFVRKSCNHAKFSMNEALSSFSAVLWNRS